MTENELRQTVLNVLHRIAPEADLESLPPDADMREELDIDSLDILRFATGLAEATGVEIPEQDYPHIVTIDGCTAYLARARAAR